jgi:cell division protein FtsB
MSRMMSDVPEVPPSAQASGQARRRLQTAQQVRDHRRRRWTWGLSFALCVLLVNAIVGENGYLATLRYRSEHAALEASVARLRYENQRLQQESRRLLNDPAALEETARETLGMVRPGETLLIYRPVRPAPPAPSSSK